MQVSQTPVQNIAAVTATRQSVSIGFPQILLSRLVIAPWRFWGRLQAAAKLSNPDLADSSEMGEAETGKVFQAVAERAIDADMGQPDHGDREHQRRGEGKARRPHRPRP